MEITRFLAKNYRTYLDLDVDLTPQDERPIILIGGANGGGKTTLFNAIHGAMYGLNITNVAQFHKELNAGVLAAGSEADEMKIELEIHFTGLVLAQKQSYIIKRTWELIDNSVRFAVMLNMNGNVIRYGSATSEKEKQIAEAQVNKIIKANLPQELSEYFLFDAMKAGEKLTESQLSRIIRENIENVMGFKKYLDLGFVSGRVKENKAAERIKQKSERDEYKQILSIKRENQELLQNKKSELKEIADKCVQLEPLVEELKSTQNQEDVLKGKREYLIKQREEVLVKEKDYNDLLKSFVKEFAINTGLPNLARLINSEVNQVISTIEAEGSGDENLTTESIEMVVSQTLDILSPCLHGANIPSKKELVKEIIKANSKNESNPWSFLETSELTALKSLVKTPKMNQFQSIDLIRTELNHSLPSLDSIEEQIEDIEKQIAGEDYSPIKRYEDLQNAKIEIQKSIEDLINEIEIKDKKLQRFDIQINEEPDPKHKAVTRLEMFFEEAADELLKAKKKQLEEQMKNDLNLNLAAYKDVIDRVELSENLKSLSFKIFHVAGNEIYLDQLNAASKQVVVQVLLKALHLFGDYDPPVMIDTVMGVLDKASRATVLENYFPSLSHQTILLSTDSEIDPDRDLEKVSAFICKSFTLSRDMLKQKTEITPGYFGVKAEELS